MSHLKVELRTLKRSSLPNGYAFDLTRHCSACWIKFGRVTNRGRKCPECWKKVCKSCRVCLCDGTNKWLCLSCCAKRYSGQSPTSRSNWLERRRPLYTTRIGSYLPCGFETGIQKQNATSSEATERRGSVDVENSLSSITDYSPENVAFSSSLVSAMAASAAHCAGQFWKPPINEAEEKETPGLYKQVSLKCKHEDLRGVSESAKDEPANSTCCMATTPTNSKFSADVSPLKGMLPHCAEQWWFIRNDPYNRLSVRDQCRAFGLRYRNLILRRRKLLCEQIGDCALFASRSVSLPERIYETDPDTERFHCDFVEYRVKKLEEELSKDLPECWFYEDIDLHSLCALDLELSVPDKDDYRLVYLSSSGTSDDSTSDSMHTANESPVPSLDCTPAKYALSGISVDSGEWDFSFLGTDSEGGSLYENKASENDTSPETEPYETNPLAEFYVESGYFEDFPDECESNVATARFRRMSDNCEFHQQTIRRGSQITKKVSRRNGCLLNKFIEALAALNQFLSFYEKCYRTLLFSYWQSSYACRPLSFHEADRKTQNTGNLLFLLNRFKADGKLTNIILDYSAPVSKYSKCHPNNTFVSSPLVSTSDSELRSDLCRCHFPAQKLSFSENTDEANLQESEDGGLEEVLEKAIVIPRAFIRGGTRKKQQRKTMEEITLGKEFIHDPFRVYKQVEQDNNTVHTEYVEALRIFRNCPFALSLLKELLELPPSNYKEIFKNVLDSVNADPGRKQRLTEFLDAGFLNKSFLSSLMHFISHSFPCILGLPNSYPITDTHLIPASEKHYALRVTSSISSLDYFLPALSFIVKIQSPSALFVGGGGLPTFREDTNAVHRTSNRENRPCFELLSNRILFHSCVTASRGSYAISLPVRLYLELRNSLSLALRRLTGSSDTRAVVNGKTIATSFRRRLLCRRRSGVLSGHPASRRDPREHGFVKVTSYVSVVLAFGSGRGRLCLVRRKSMPRQGVSPDRTSTGLSHFSVFNSIIKRRCFPYAIARKTPSDRASGKRKPVGDDVCILNGAENYTYSVIDEARPPRTPILKSSSKSSESLSSKQAGSSPLSLIETEYVCTLGHSLPRRKKLLKNADNSCGNRNGIVVSQSGESADTINPRRESQLDSTRLSTSSITASCAPETGVIDTQTPSVTSKTGRAAFAEGRSRTSVSGESRLPRVLCVPAVQRSVKHELLRSLSDPSSPKPRADVSEGLATWMTTGSRTDNPHRGFCKQFSRSYIQQATVDFLLASLSSLSLPASSSFARSDYSSKSLTVRREAEQLVPVTFDGGNSGLNVDDSEKMSFLDGISPNSGEGKIARLKKFFDSGAKVLDDDFTGSKSEAGGDVNKVSVDCVVEKGDDSNLHLSPNSSHKATRNVVDTGRNPASADIGEITTDTGDIKTGRARVGDGCLTVESGEGDRGRDVEQNGKVNGLWDLAGAGPESSVPSCVSNGDDAFIISQSATDSVSVSTQELNSLIAASKAELSRTSESVPLPEKSNLECYFERAFENSHPTRRASHPTRVQDDECSPNSNGNIVGQPSAFEDAVYYRQSVKEGRYLDSPHGVMDLYGCNSDEMYFDDLDDDVVLSDTSSDEEVKCQRSPTNNAMAQPYALHTIIEESCEESERDSRNATPTNQAPASKLERYFSWDIVSNSKSVKPQAVDDDDVSTLYSDSLSEGSGSLTGDNIEPSPLQSSCLEKYFTSGLIGNDTSHCPDDVEMFDDTSVSDFDDDDKGHKISRAALLNSIEVMRNGPTNRESRQEHSTKSCESSADDHFAATGEADIPEEASCSEKSCDQVTGVTVRSEVEMTGTAECPVEDERATASEDVTEVHKISASDATHPVNCSLSFDDCNLKVHGDVQEREGGGSISEKEHEMNYIAAWQLLENELQQLMKNVSSSSQLDSNSESNSSSTFGSSHSDYGSDTVDSGECLTTDEDDNCTEFKNKRNSSQTLLWNLKVSQTKYLTSNPQDNLDLLKKILQFFNKECLTGCLDVLSKNDSNLRNQMVSVFRAIASSHQLSSIMEYRDLNDIQEALVSLGKLEDGEAVPKDLEYQELTSSTEPKSSLTVDEGISVDSTENLAAESGASTPDHSEPAKESKTTESGSSSENVDHTKPSVIVSSVNSTVTEVEPEVAGPCSSTSSSPLRSVSESDLPSNRSIEDSSSVFSVYVDIEIRDDSTSVKERQNSCPGETPKEHRSSVHLWVSDDTPKEPAADCEEVQEADDSNEPAPTVKVIAKKAVSEPSLLENSDFVGQQDDQTVAPSSSGSHRDTGYYSFKSSDNSILHPPEPDESIELEINTKDDFQCSNSSSRCSSIKSSLSAKALSQSITNLSSDIHSDLKFSSLQPRPRMNMVSMNPQHCGAESRPLASYLSPASVFKKFKSNKSTGSPSSEISYPSKYLKKYGRSSSFDSETMSGATSLPHLNLARGDAYSMNGVMFDSDRDSSLTLDDDNDVKHSYFSSNHSALSLGAHSASTTSVYSSAGGRYFCSVSISGDVLFGLNYNQKSQAIEVFVKQCRNLTAVDVKKNRSDPYVKVYLLPDKSKSGKRKTKTKKNTLNPVFNELLRFPVLKHELEARTLWLSVWNSDLFGRNDFLGEVRLVLGQRLLDSPTLRWYPLQERAESLSAPLNYKGELFLALRYVPKDLSLEPRFRPAPVISLKGALHVLVKEARNIAAGKGGTFDTFCKSYLLPDKSKSSKQKTPIVKRSQHPKWYYTIVYEDLSVEELKERSLELTLWDHDRITSNEFIGGVRLNVGTGLYHGVPVEWMDASRDEASLWQAMLERPNMWVDGSLPLRPTLQSLRS